MPSEHKEAMTPERSKRETADAARRPKVKEAGKRSMRGPEKIGGRRPRNHEFAGRTYHFEKTRPQRRWRLESKYPEGVRFDSAADAKFTPYALKSVEIDVTGNHGTDTTKANEAANLKRTPKGTVWHHCQDTKTMELVPQDLHTAVGHTGGVAVINAQEGDAE